MWSHGHNFVRSSAGVCPDTKSPDLIQTKFYDPLQPNILHENHIPDV